MGANSDDARGNAIDALLAKQQIREALETFSKGMDRFDRDAFLAAFWDDATIAAGPFVGSPADCWDWAVPMHEEGQSLTQHALFQSNIEVDGDSAHCETYYQFVARNRDETLVLAGGRYVDRLEKRGESWRIILRTNLIEWACMPQEIPVPFSDIEDAKKNGLPSRDLTDPSYQRPLVNRRSKSNPASV
ncbi:nuclear transport factor 2 family protein [Pontixanthobacter aquaemixtae]|uniref:DUF4440 domain-containing protein n=1 Tax=Pontixanthobacter aquaemixtae TaxID=1958940 RepID=A0A844ZQ88_9SPHN|nr:nuclear transport factor 2 family protein [Pontixanthobacter aquaemixtae]MXO89908.1 DUF4440 domain-containing protein [Pontixanthobacter aquaemixtae]